jgi:LmbE family N-acetylglucosaminyl deacetylase
MAAGREINTVSASRSLPGGGTGLCSRHLVERQVILRVRVIPVMLFLLGLAALGILTTGPRAGAAPGAIGPESPDDLAVNSSTSLLVVSPHPDDESLCCAGAIQRVLHAGGHVTVVWVTSGDGSEIDLLLIERSLFAKPEKIRDLAGRRMKEARTATALLGVDADRQLFLGYPDGGLTPLLTDHFETPYRSKLTGTREVPYPDAVFPGHPYTGQSLEKDFAAVLDRVRPTLVLAPSPEDTHPDHRAAGLLTIRLLTRRGALASARYYIVHGGEGWPSPRGLNAELPLPTTGQDTGLGTVSLALESGEENRKLQAIQAYRTQMQVMPSFLLAFARTTETFFLQPFPPALATRAPAIRDR